MHLQPNADARLLPSENKHSIFASRLCLDRKKTQAIELVALQGSLHWRAHQSGHSEDQNQNELEYIIDSE